MQLFSEYMERHNREQGYGYVSVKPVSETVKLIRNLIYDAGITNSIENVDLHMTLAYDTNNPVLDVELPLNTRIKGTATGIKLLGDSLVIIIDSESAQKRYNELSDLGFGSDYPNFLPHISLKYNASKEDFLDIKNAFKKFKDKNVIFYDECWEFNTGSYL